MTIEMIVFLLALGLAVLAALLVAAAAGTLAWLAGTRTPAALARAGVAFAATLTLAIVLINTLTQFRSAG